MQTLRRGIQQRRSGLNQGRYLKVIGTLALGSMLGLGMAGCQSPVAVSDLAESPATVVVKSEEPTQSAASVPEPTPEPTQETTPEPTQVPTLSGIQINGSTNVENPEGYTLTIDYAIQAPGFTADPTNALPGETDLVSDSQVVITATNTTPQRAARGDTLFATPVSFFAASSPICKSELEMERLMYTY